MVHERLGRAIQNLWRGLCCQQRVCLIKTTPGRPHVAAATREKIDSFGWESFDLPLYRPDLLSSNYHLFPKVKDFFYGVLFVSDEELANSQQVVRKHGGYFSMRMQ